VQDAQIEGYTIKVDDFIDGMSLRAEKLIDGRKIRTSFHLDVGIPLTVNDIEHISILQERAHD